MRRISLVLLSALLPLVARAADSATVEAQRAQVEALRKEVAGQLQLQAYDLLDELVYGWTQAPVFPVETPVVLADVTVPWGFGSGLQALLENHITGLLIKNPRSHMRLAHCPACTSMVVRSGAKGTVVSRGVDEPEALSAASAQSGSHHALFLDFEVEGSALVLRARVTSLEPSLPIVFAKTLSSSTSTAALLRSDEHLKSAAEARQEYLDALQGRGPLLVPMRLGIRSYASRPGDAPVMSAPFVWLQLGAELSLTQTRAWTASLSGGVSWAPQLHTAFLGQARISRLLTGSVTSLTHPDLYGFVGLSVISVHGQSALAFQEKVPTLENLKLQLTGNEPTATFSALQVGLELRIKNRLGAGIFLENLPSLGSAQAIGRYVNLGIIQFQSLGAEVSVCF